MNKTTDDENKQQLEKIYKFYRCELCAGGVQSSHLFSSRTKWGPAEIAGLTQLARQGQLHCNLSIRLFHADLVICVSLFVAHSCEEILWENYDFVGHLM